MWMPAAFADAGTVSTETPDVASTTPVDVGTPTPAPAPAPPPSPSQYPLCCRTRLTPFERAMKTIALSENSKLILEERYVRLLKHMQTRANRYATAFHISRTIITVGSLIVPALLSIQYTDGLVTEDNKVVTSVRIYWVTWVISLLVTMSNGLLTLFKLDKRYYLLHTTYEQLISEGWQFLELTAKYSGHHTPGTKPTHQNQFIYFTHAIEKIRMRQVEEEYYKLSELHSQGGAGGGSNQRGAQQGDIRAPAAGTTASNSSTAPQQQQPSQVPEVNLSNIIPLSPMRGDISNIPSDVLSIIQQHLSRNRVENAAAAGAAAREAAIARREEEFRQAQQQQGQSNAES